MHAHIVSMNPSHALTKELRLDGARGIGIDHVWHQSRLPFGYRITDTKGTRKGRHRLMTPKAFFDAARQGHGVGRVLDGMRGVMKGDVDKWLKNIDWTSIASRAKGTLDDALAAAFIDGLDSWAVKAVAGRANVNMLIDELKGLRRVAPKRLDEAVTELKQLHRKILDDLAPTSTAARNPAGGGRKAAQASDAGRAAPAHPKPAERTSGSTTRKADRTADNPGAADTKKKDQAREAKKKKDNWRSGVLPEHITDYHVAKRNTNFKKVNDHGRKIEEHDSARGIGIDHVWRNTGCSVAAFEQGGGKGGKPYVIGETKGSLLGAFAFLAALPPDLRQHFDALRADEASGASPNAFGNDKRDTAPEKKSGVTTDQGLTKGGIDQHGAREQGLNPANERTALPTQMSHEWIERSLRTDSTLTPDADALRQQIRSFRKGRISTPPYHRWVFMVTGRQKHLHESSKKTPPHRHEIQRPIVVIPDPLLNQ